MFLYFSISYITRISAAILEPRSGVKIVRQKRLVMKFQAPQRWSLTCKLARAHASEWQKHRKPPAICHLNYATHG